ncbi:MAG TPA: sigma-54 dependent transcriptional regulator [Phycisphaerae bacterium]|nr:sigma-54 dependent transcriptional regulator [Phycisphaerae bacterium]
MDRLGPMVLDVWRKVCRHIEIQEAADRIAGLLASALPIQDLLIRQFDLHRSAIETVAHAACGQPADWPPRTECKPELMTDLLAWCRRNAILRSPAAKVTAPLRSGLPGQLRGDLMIGPLSDEETPIGILVFTARRGQRFDATLESLFGKLLEPLSVAMLNDARLREIATLREAAEADKRSLLTRLGRQDITDVIVGADNGLRQVMERVELVAPSDAPVLLFGETGSGKEVVARALHARSPRAAGPFLRVNCGAIPPDLMDSELFGHEKGSFTGATNLRKGWFERADSGTLFLDEIGELPVAAQVRLLRILQDGTFERVGGQRQLHVNVRIVAATHRNLQAMVAEGRFREDLWYRIAVFPIYLPALRDRPEDIPEMASHFALKSARRFGLTPIAPTTDDLHLLISYPWPGNVRELGAVMDRAVILGNGQRLEIAKALGATEAPASPNVRSHAGIGHQLSATSASPFPTLDAAMRRHIELALAKSNGRIEGRNGTAELLGINPYTLRGRMRKLGIGWAKFRSLR